MSGRSPDAVANGVGVGPGSRDRREVAQLRAMLVLNDLLEAGVAIKRRTGGIVLDIPDAVLEKLTEGGVCAAARMQTTVNRALKP